MDFENKVVLVTGASAGIGEATAILFAKHGAKLSIVGQNEKRLRDVAEKCRKEKGKEALTIVANLGTDEGCEKVAKDTLEHFRRLDVLVNNAGVGVSGSIENTDMKEYDKAFNLNVRGVYNLTRLLAPALIAAKGNVVNVSSIAGTVPAIGTIPYSMTKAAVDHFTRLVALELAPKGVRVNAVSPGVTISQFVTRMTDFSEDQYQDWLKLMSKGVPMKKPCTGDDIGRMILHLASEASSLVTGVVATVDGGLALAGATAFGALQQL